MKEGRAGEETERGQEGENGESAKKGTREGAIKIGWREKEREREREKEESDSRPTSVVENNRKR